MVLIAMSSLSYRFIYLWYIYRNMSTNLFLFSSIPVTQYTEEALSQMKGGQFFAVLWCAWVCVCVYLFIVLIVVIIIIIVLLLLLFGTWLIVVHFIGWIDFFLMTCLQCPNWDRYAHLMHLLLLASSKYLFPAFRSIFQRLLVFVIIMCLIYIIYYFFVPSQFRFLFQLFAFIFC